MDRHDGRAVSTVRSLRSSRDFARVTRTGRRARRDGLTVYVAAREGSTETRVGLAVGSRVGNAVVRNRVKRRLRGAFGELAVPAGFDVVIRAHPDLVGRNYQKMKADLAAALRPAIEGRR